MSERDEAYREAPAAARNDQADERADPQSHGRRTKALGHRREFHEVTLGWPGMPTQTKLVDLGREVSVGTQIQADGLWWVVEQVGPAVGGHRGRVRATATGVLEETPFPIACFIFARGRRSIAPKGGRWAEGSR